MPLGTDYARQDCSLARSLELVGERWTLLILRDAFLGVRRFSDFQTHLDISKAVLSARLEALVAELQLENNVRFLGRRPHNRIMSLMSGADVFLHCSDHEGLPVSIHEAIAAGLPVIAARVGGIPDLVREGENGRLLGPDDERGFARAILELTGDVETRAKMAASSIEFARLNLSANAVIVKIEETIKAAIASA